MNLKIIHPPNPGSKEEYADLRRVIDQYENRIVPENLQKRCDEGMVEMMAEYLANRGLSIDLVKLTRYRKAVIPTIKLLKNYFNRPRPRHTAAKRGIPFSGDYLETAQSSSYPSGHTIQAYICAAYCAKIYPEHSVNLFMIANLVAQSRIDRGVHFPSDIEYGILIASQISDQVFSGQ